jgi:hypothetical protein
MKLGWKGMEATTTLAYWSCLRVRVGACSAISKGREPIGPFNQVYNSK